MANSESAGIRVKGTISEAGAKRTKNRCWRLPFFSPNESGTEKQKHQDRHADAALGETLAVPHIEGEHAFGGDAPFPQQHAFRKRRQKLARGKLAEFVDDAGNSR